MLVAKSIRSYASLVLITSFLALFLKPADLLAQQYNFRNYTVKDGLSRASLGDALIDKRGKLWVVPYGTGVDILNGTEFSSINETNGLPENGVNEILEDRKGNIWFAMINSGLVKYNGKTFQHFGEKEGLPATNITSICEDLDGNLFLGTYGKGLYKFNGKTFESQQAIVPETTVVFRVNIDTDGTIWVGTSKDGVYGIPSNKEKEPVHFTREDGLSSNTVGVSFKDKSGALWFGTDGGGVNRYNGQSFTVYKTEQGLSNNRVYDILEDRNGVMWFATDRGLSKFDGNSFKVFTKENGLLSNVIMRILNDEYGTIYLTTGGGLSIFDSEQFSVFSEKEGLDNNKIYAMIRDDSAGIWLASYSDGIIHLSGIDDNVSLQKKTIGIAEGLASDKVMAMCKVGNTLWIGTHGEGLWKYDGESVEKIEIGYNLIRVITADLEGNLWMSAKSHYDNTGDRVSLVKFNTTSGQIEIELDKEKGFDQNFISSILVDHNQHMWACTGGGLYKYDGSKLKQYTTENGLAENKVRQAIQDEHQNIIVAAFNGTITVFHPDRDIPFAHFNAKDGLDAGSYVGIGISQTGDIWLTAKSTVQRIHFTAGNNLLNKDAFTVIKYGNEEGYRESENVDAAVYNDGKGSIWFGTTDGVIRYSEQFDKIDSIVPGIALNGVRMFYKQNDWKKYTSNFSSWDNIPQDLNLPYNKNHLTFYFSGIHRVSPKKLQYQWKIKGFDKNWSPITSEKKATYSNLPPGDYTFQVKAISPNGKVSKLASVHFTIQTPYWQTWWFYSICALVILIIVIAVIKLREVQLQKQKRVLELQVINRTSEIKRQKEIVEGKNKEITDSINYAKRIQQAIQPLTETFEKSFADSFVLSEPKDIVSGDFYWYHKSKKSDEVLFAVADCTGHGVPGAIVSVIGHNGLNRSVKEFGITEPAGLLYKLNELVEETFEASGSEVRDGMDIALCKFDAEKRELEFSGAHNPLWLIRHSASSELELESTKEAQVNVTNNEGGDYKLYEVKADKIPIGSFNERVPYTNHKLQLQKGDAIYLFSDGYADQFGGPKGKKFKYSRFKELLLSIQDKNMKDQLALVRQSFLDWKGDLEQLDDVFVVGIRI